MKAGGRGGLLSSDKVPQWAGWALKAISGKFYKSATPQPVEGGVQPAQENQPESSNLLTEKPPKKPEVARKESSEELDGWGEIDDEPVAEVNSWSKPVRETKEKVEVSSGWDQDEADDWSTDWEKPKKQNETIKTSAVASKNSKGAGSLKLSAGPKQTPGNVFYKKMKNFS